MTDCLDPMAPTDDELRRYALDGEPLSEEFQNHLDSCPICKQRVALYTSANAFLTTTLYRSECPTPAKLADFCTPISFQFLSTNERKQIAEHMNVCPLCSAEVATLRRDLATTDLFPASEPSIFATVQSFSAPATVRRLVATLQTQRPQLITRNDPNGNTASDTHWPKHYKADTLDISLHLSRGSNGEILLLGLFTSTDPNQDIEAFEGCIVDLYTHPIASEKLAQQNGHVAQPLQSTHIDDLGNIIFKAVAPGVYTMLVHLSDAELSIEGINIDHT